MMTAVATISSDPDTPADTDPIPQMQLVSLSVTQATPATPEPPAILAAPVAPATTTTEAVSIPTSSVILSSTTSSTPQITQLITSSGSAVEGPQKIVNIAGQNVLISGGSPGTVGNVSVRYGKILKGIHQFFCAKCKHPFTSKADQK